MNTKILTLTWMLSNGYKTIGVHCDWVETFDTLEDENLLEFSPEEVFRLFTEMVKSQLPDFDYEIMQRPKPINHTGKQVDSATVRAAKLPHLFL